MLILKEIILVGINKFKGETQPKNHAEFFFIEFILHLFKSLDVMIPPRKLEMGIVVGSLYHQFSINILQYNKLFHLFQ